MAGEVRFYTLEDAARILRLSPDRVRQMLEDGEIEGARTGDTGGWRIPLRGAPDVPPPVDAPPPPTEPTTRPAPPGAPGPPGEDHGSADETLEEARQPAELPRGYDAAISPEVSSESGWVTTQQAARALGISARTVRWHIERGNLDAKPEGEGVERTWRVSVDSLQALRDSRKRRARSPRDNRATVEGAEIAAEDPGSAIRALADRLVEEARRAEAARVRLELAERAQSTLEAELAEERRRREEAEKARERTQRELEELRGRLESERAQTPRPEPRPAPAAPPEPREVAPGPPETPAQGFGTDAAGGGPQRQASPRWWSRWRRR